jgi:site-specific DNA recombinase
MAGRTRKTGALSGESKKNAVLYLRISHDPKMDGFAIDRQREDCTKVAKSHNLNVVGEFVDHSVSATDKSKKRPQYQRLIAERDSGKFDALVFWDLDRFTRQPRELEDWVDFIEEHPYFRVYSVSGEINFNTAIGKAEARNRATWARLEVERKSERQKRAQLQRAEQGRPPKGTRPLGYETKDYKLIPHEAKVVLAIYEAFLGGASIRSISRALSGETGPRIPKTIPKMPSQKWVLQQERKKKGFTKLTANKDAPWSQPTVKTILRNPSYAGYSTYGPQAASPNSKTKDRESAIVRDNNNVPVRGIWEPIVSTEMWEEVQVILNDKSRNKRGPGTDRKYLGTGVFFCGDCGEKVKAGGGKYRCNHEKASQAIRDSCRSIVRNKDQIDEHVEALIRARLARPDAIKFLAKKDVPRLKEISTLISELRGNILRAQKDYDDKIIEGFDLKRVRDTALAEIEKLEIEKTKLAAADINKTILMANKPVEAFDNADLATKRAFINSICKVTLLHGKPGRHGFDYKTVPIDWIYPDGAKAASSKPGRKTNRATTSKPAK